MTREMIFTDIFTHRKWGEKETVSGKGSKVENTAVVRSLISKSIKEFGIKSILDIPCGDFNWMGEVDLSEVEYMGADIVDDLIALNISKHRSDSVSFKKMDVISDDLPCYDLVVCRDCLIHMPVSYAIRAVENIMSSGARHLISTTFPCSENGNPNMGRFGPINLEDDDFKLGAPVILKREGRSRRYPNKSIGLWELNTLTEKLQNCNK